MTSGESPCIQFIKAVYYSMRIGKYLFINGSRRKQLEILDAQFYIGSKFPDFVPQ